MDRSDEWRMFVAVAGARSFAIAARSLGRSPQAATRAVAALERRIGTRLLARTTRSVSLTSDGVAYLERGKRLLAELDALEAPIDAAAPLRGTLAITAPVLFGQLHVAPVVAELLADHPALDARLLLVDRVVSLAEEGIDVGIRIGTLPDSAIHARRVGQVRAVVCASPDYLSRAGRPRTPADLARHACVAFSATTPIPDRWSFRKPGGPEVRVAVRARLIVNTGQAAIDAARTGLGIVRLLSYQVDPLVDAGALVVLLRNFEPDPSPVQLVQLPGVRSRAAQAFVDLAADRLAKGLRR